MAETTTLNAVLTTGFSQAAGRVGAIVTDLLWKIVWLAITGLAFLLVAVWVQNELGSLEIAGPTSSLSNPLALMILARQLWEMYASTLFVVLVAFVSVSALAWILLESYFRAGLLPVSGESFARRASGHFSVFLTSAALKLLAVGGTATAFALIVFGRYLSAPVAEWGDLWIDTRGPFVVAILVLLTLWFASTLLETLIRSNSLELLGREFFLVVGLVATLLWFEGMIAASAAVGIIVLMLSVAGPGGLVLSIGAVLAVAVVLSVLHSYLLLVRFASLAEIRGLTPNYFE